MKIEKKLIACSILAIAIGIATIIPLEYLMTAEIQVSAQPIKPWFDVNVPYAYVNLHQSGENNTVTWDGAMIQVLANFSLTPDALKNADAQIEYYKFAVSSDQGPVVDMGYYFLRSKHASDVTSLSGTGTITFANGLTYTGPACNGGQGGLGEANRTLAFVSNFILGYNDNGTPQEVTQLRNAQKLYIDISKVCTVTVNGNITVTTPANGETLQHIELTKSENGFIYGSYTEGTIPFPVETPTTTLSPTVTFATPS